MKSQATFAGGCFWCTEAIFSQLKGVENVLPGYTGGLVKNPSYKEVCTGRTGHAEAVFILYRPKEITYTDLLEVFFATHDPTMLNQQGNDIGEQYRSAIFYHDELQKQQAEAYIRQLELAKIFNQPIITKLEPATDFYTSEPEHHDYFRQNPDQMYCATVINPKVQKFKLQFTEKLKK